jgi:hypothetical protein
MDCKENEKYDIAGKPEAGTRDPKGKGKLLDKSPHGRLRPVSTQDEIEDDPKENATSQERVRQEQGGKSHHGNTN